MLCFDTFPDLNDEKSFSNFPIYMTPVGEVLQMRKNVSFEL